MLKLSAVPHPEIFCEEKKLYYLLLLKIFGDEFIIEIGDKINDN